MALSEKEVAAVLKRFDLAKKRKTQWSELYEEALEYAAPHRETFNSDFDTPGQDKMGRGLVFDSTALDAMQKFASNLQSSLVPPFTDWIRLKPGSAVADEEGLEEILKEVTEVYFSHIQNSNFDTQIAESFLDLAVGTGAMLLLKGTRDRPFHFVNVPLSQLFLEEGANGVIDTAFRQSKIQIRNIEKTWEDAEISEALSEKVRQDPNAEIKIIEATIATEITVFNSVEDRDELVDGFLYVVIENETKTVIVEREQKSSPWLVFRWSTIPGEIYGRGPLLFALPDIKTLNKTKELLLQSASIAIFGMYTVEDDGIINIENIELGPGAMIPVDSNGRQGRGPSLQPLNPAGSPDLGQIIVQDLKQNINSIMFADPLGPIDLPVKSATEVSLRQQNLARRIGSAFGRLQFELITPLVNRGLDILDELGLIDLGPFRVDGNIIAIEHVSPLAMAQEEEQFVNMIRLAEMVVGLYGPEVLMGMIPPDRFITEAAKKINVDRNVIASEEEIATMKQAIQQQAEIASQQQVEGET